MNQNQGSTKQRLIEAAVQLFSRQGYSGTNTYELAHGADVNQASLFRHFSKEDLFWAALRSRLEQVRLGKELQEGLSRVDRPEQVLPLIFEFLVHTAVCQFELIRLLNVGFLELRPGTERLYREHFAPVFCAIYGYLAACSKNGWLRSIDPSITTTAIVATVFAHQSMYPLLANTPMPYANQKEAVSAYSKHWLSLLMPDTEPKGLLAENGQPRYVGHASAQR
jgi:AcrR family transcriptional regulator